MKGIKCCGECVYYNMKKHKCIGGAQYPGKAEDSFYTDCPHVEAYSVRHGWWELKMLGIGGGDKIRAFQCSECNRYVNFKFDFCPNCGADMREEVQRNAGTD